jgi:hypothetical protein
MVFFLKKITVCIGIVRVMGEGWCIRPSRRRVHGHSLSTPRSIESISAHCESHLSSSVFAMANLKPCFNCGVLARGNRINEQYTLAGDTWI